MFRLEFEPTSLHRSRNAVKLLQKLRLSIVANLSTSVRSVSELRFQGLSGWSPLDKCAVWRAVYRCEALRENRWIGLFAFGNGILPFCTPTSER
jgi:hypothetical protein